MLIAPHPNDEALAAGVILHRALQAGSAVRVVYVTDGDNNPWPQRIMERKWRLDAVDRQRWGRLRRGEAIAALRILGLDRKHADFLGLQDQGLTTLLLGETLPTTAYISDIIRKWRPTELLLPVACDRHPDHSAVAVLTRLALSHLGAVLPEIQPWSYLVHGRSDSFSGLAEPLVQTAAETIRKRCAIRCHKSQIKLSRRRFLEYAMRPECFVPVATNAAAGSIRSASRAEQMIRLDFDMQSKLWFAAGDADILMLGQDPSGAPKSLRISMPSRSGVITVEDWKTRRPLSTARFQKAGFTGSMFIPENLFSTKASLFVKYNRPSWFFDEAGWFELSPPQAKHHPNTAGATDEKELPLSYSASAL